MIFDNPVTAAGVPVMGGLAANHFGNGLRMPGSNWVRMRQPFIDDFGRACVLINDLRGTNHPGGFTRNDSRGGEKLPVNRVYLLSDLAYKGYPTPITANATTLTKGQWIEMDQQIYKAFRQDLRAAADLESASSYGGFNAMGRMTLEYQAVNDPGSAVVDMDGRTDARNDRALHILRSLPLPITHSDFGMSSRELEVSRSGPTPFPLDTNMGEFAARRVAESVEDTVIGNLTGATYGTQTAGYPTHTGTSTVYGYRSFPQRLTKTNFTTPTSTNGPTVYGEVLAAISQLLDQLAKGPFVVYHSIDWEQFLHAPFSTSGGNHPGETLRTMLLKIPAIADVRRLDRLTATYTLLFVSMRGEVAQMVNGMDVTTVQWEEKGGLELRFKVMCIKVPRLKSDFASRTGILHGTTS